MTLLALQGCDAIAPSSTPEVKQSPAPTSSPSPVPAAKIVIGVHVGDDAVGSLPGFFATDMPLFPALANGHWWDRVVRRLVYSGVYRYTDNAADEPVADLASERCTWSPDLLDITCRLREAFFHDGTPLTAVDVAYTFQLRASDACFVLEQDFCIPNLERADAEDVRTVVFHLGQPDATFLSVALPEVLIESKARIEDSYARFRDGSRGAKPAEVKAAAARIGLALVGDSPNCPALAADAETEVRTLGLEPWSRAEFNLGPGFVFVPCAYTEYLVRVLDDAAASLALDGIDAIEAAYRILDYQDELPVGSGPWRVGRIDPGRQMDLEAFEAFHRGPPVTAGLEVRLIRTKADAVNAVRDHSVDWLVQPFAGQFPYFLREGLDGEEGGLTLTVYDTPSWFALYYNVRPGALFAEARLREAVELCIDKAETVRRATRGQFRPIQSPVVPSSWAYEKALKAPDRDVERAHALIRDAGWKLGADGIYAKGGIRLSAKVPVREGRPERLTFLGLLEDQVKDCGMEITPLETAAMGDVLTWPHDVPGTGRPWDLAFNGQIGFGTPDPANDDPVFRSDHITSEANKKGDNVTGYSNPEVDDLLDQARKTYVLNDRARRYRQYQVRLAEDRPMLFAYAPRLIEARIDRLRSTEGPLSSSSEMWWWQLETLVKDEPAR